MFAPFKDVRVGVDAGKVVHHNLDQGVIPRMPQFADIVSSDFQ